MFILIHKKLKRYPLDNPEDSLYIRIKIKNKREGLGRYFS